MIGGRYTLERKIGRGGMGSVWLGRDEVLGRAVAVKRIGVSPDDSSPDLLRAEREARIAASLNHPHVVGVFDLVHTDDEQWLVMEYVEGTTLAELIRSKGPVPPDRLAAILAQTAAALAAAHAAGVVHRDVKPSNILVGTDGSVRLSDFGIARAGSDPSLTRTGLVTGSPAYLAPEVASGRQATAAADVWAFGATTFHSLAGRPPYDVGDNVLGALYRIVHDEPPRLSAAEAGELAPLLEASMVLDPTRRWSSEQVSEFLDRLAPGAVERRSPGSGAAPLTPLTAPAVAAPPQAPVADLTAPAPLLAPTPPGSRRATRRRLPVLPLAVLAVVVVLLVILAIALLQPDPQGDLATSTPTGSPTSGGTSPTSPSTSATTDPARARAAAMRTFVRDYLRTADASPAQGYALLTPQYQQASGGRSGYESFWGNLSDARLQAGSLKVDADTLVASYTYSYTKPQTGTRSDVVHLQLQPDGSGSFLIAGASSGGG